LVEGGKGTFRQSDQKRLEWNQKIQQEEIHENVRAEFSSANARGSRNSKENLNNNRKGRRLGKGGGKVSRQIEG